MLQIHLSVLDAKRVQTESGFFRGVKSVVQVPKHTGNQALLVGMNELTFSEGVRLPRTSRAIGNTGSMYAGEGRIDQGRAHVCVELLRWSILVEDPMEAEALGASESDGFQMRISLLLVSIDGEAFLHFVWMSFLFQRPELCVDSDLVELLWCLRVSWLVCCWYVRLVDEQ